MKLTLAKFLAILLLPMSLLAFCGVANADVTKSANSPMLLADGHDSTGGDDGSTNDNGSTDGSGMDSGDNGTDDSNGSDDGTGTNTN